LRLRGTSINTNINLNVIVYFIFLPVRKEDIQQMYLFSSPFLIDHNVNNLTVQYQIAKFGQGFTTSYYFTSSHDINIDCSEYVLMPGDWEIRAEVTDNDNSTGNKYYSNALEIAALYPDVDSIKNSSDVLGVVDGAWQETKSAATANSIYEYGGGVYIVSAIFGSSPVLVYEVGPDQQSPPFGCSSTETSWPIGVNFTGDPVDGATFLAATYHTHPPFTYCSYGDWRYVGPSDWDNSSTVPGVLIDYVGTGGKTFWGDDINGTTEIYTYGPERRSIQ